MEVPLLIASATSKAADNSSTINWSQLKELVTPNIPVTTPNDRPSPGEWSVMNIKTKRQKEATAAFNTAQKQALAILRIPSVKKKKSKWDFSHKKVSRYIDREPKMQLYTPAETDSELRTSGYKNKLLKDVDELIKPPLRDTTM